MLPVTASHKFRLPAGDAKHDVSGCVERALVADEVNLRLAVDGDGSNRSVAPGEGSRNSTSGSRPSARATASNEPSRSFVTEPAKALGPITVTPAAANSLTFLQRSGREDRIRLLRQHEIAVAHAVGQRQPAVAGRRTSQQDFRIEHVIVETGDPLWGRGGMKLGMASFCR